MTWLDRAACKEVDMDGGNRFHPSVTTQHDGGRNAKAAYEVARTWCRVCPVTLECLRYAMTHETPSTRAGVWGGLSPRQRSTLERDVLLTDAIARALKPVLMADDEPSADWSMAEMRAGIAAYERHRKGGPAPTEDQINACRAYHRIRAARARDHKRKAQKS